MGNYLHAIYRLPVLTLPALALAACGELGTIVSDSDFCDGYTPSRDSKFILPLKTGTKAKISQGNCGTVTHKGAIRYAYDFWDASGTELRAALGGKVIKVVQDIADGNSAYSGGANEIRIEHGDGTIGSYGHLKSGTAVVSVNDSVSQGQLIALMGASGTGGPHLHFQVYQSASVYQTIPITFRNTKEHFFALNHDSEYDVYTYVPVGSTVLLPTVYKNTATDCIINSAALGTDAPATTNMSAVEANVLSKMNTKDGTDIASIECNYATATTNAMAALVSFDASEYALGSITNVKFDWKGAAGVYATACAGTTTLAAGAGVSPPLRNIQVYKYNANVSPAWTDLSVTAVTSTEATLTLTEPHKYQYTDGKIWFRITGGDPGIAGQCSSIAIDYLRLQVNP